MSRRTTQAGNRASQSGRSLQRWDRPSECMGLSSGKTKLHDYTIFNTQFVGTWKCSLTDNGSQQTKMCATSEKCFCQLEALL